MRAMVLKRVGEIDAAGAAGDGPLEAVEWEKPTAGAGEVLVRVSVCGVCHTELDEIEGRTAPPRLPVIPGHEIVGRVEAVGAGATRHRVGDRVGVGWIHRSCGGAEENLDEAFEATGRDAHGGYAEYTTVPEAYAFALPAGLDDEAAAPLLCAGAIGWRSLKLTGLRDGEPLGLTGFGASAHLVLPLARHRFPNSAVYVFARSEHDRAFARELGAAWAGATAERAPVKLRAIIDTTPAWTPIVEALANLAPGGRLVINAIRKEAGDRDALLRLDYAEHLWLEKEIKSVANITGSDIAEFLPIAAAAGLRPTVTAYPLAEANRALRELKRGAGKGAKVLRVWG